ncbi:unnamed protein product [Schistocephalus solidus]|uniref:Uncharacterized protein n=1 Tax=Schistocephalus solidus TaxID=70667 RepID=A0A183TFE8_SCHSO|nr:unnamed protein product [Schistocephalus solidus]
MNTHLDSCLSRDTVLEVVRESLKSSTSTLQASPSPRTSETGQKRPSASGTSKCVHGGPLDKYFRSGHGNQPACTSSSAANPTDGGLLVVVKTEWLGQSTFPIWKDLLQAVASSLPDQQNLSVCCLPDVLPVSRQSPEDRRWERVHVAGAAGAAPGRATTPGSDPTEWECHKGHIKKEPLQPDSQSASQPLHTKHTLG